jgi:spore coat polysaccharide biosynthesis protein SpsF
VIVARTGSTRVPGKALYLLSGKPVLLHVIDRVKACKTVNTICLATTSLSADDTLVALAAEAGIEVYRGDPEKVLDRVYLAAQRMNSANIIEIGGDCPLIDPKILDEAIKSFFEISCDYLYNYDPPTFPEGLDINVVSMSALAVAYHNALAPSNRIHPFSYLADNKDLFRVRNYTFEKDLSRFHWSFDFPEDFAFIDVVYGKLYKENAVFGLENVLELIECDRQVYDLNENLRKQPALHAFWNSPGIIRDLGNDIDFLVKHADKAMSANEYALANRCYKEIMRRATELYHFTQSKLS